MYVGDLGYGVRASQTFPQSCPWQVWVFVLFLPWCSITLVHWSRKIRGKPSHSMYKESFILIFTWLGWVIYSCIMNHVDVWPTSQKAWDSAHSYAVVCKSYAHLKHPGILARPLDTIEDGLGPSPTGRWQQKQIEAEWCHDIQCIPGWSYCQREDHNHVVLLRWDPTPLEVGKYLAIHLRK